MHDSNPRFEELWNTLKDPSLLDKSDELAKWERELMEAVANRYPELDLGFVTIPSMVMSALPYLLTVIILAGFIGRATPPRAGGEPYVKER